MEITQLSLVYDPRIRRWADERGKDHARNHHQDDPHPGERKNKRDIMKIQKAELSRFELHSCLGLLA